MKACDDFDQYSFSFENLEINYVIHTSISVILKRELLFNADAIFDFNDVNLSRVWLNNRRIVTNKSGEYQYAYSWGWC